MSSHKAHSDWPCFILLCVTNELHETAHGVLSTADEHGSLAPFSCSFLYTEANILQQFEEGLKISSPPISVDLGTLDKQIEI